MKLLSNLAFHYGQMARWLTALAAAVLLPLPGFAFDALAHNMAGKDADFVAHSVGPQILPFL